MWYEILAPMGIMFITVSLPCTVCIPAFRKWWYGHIYWRDIDIPHIEHFWMRDMHLTGNPFKPNGIETLPDEPPAK